MIITAIIPARGGSQGLPGKNIRLIGGRPLISWSIQQALDTAGVDSVVVSTDSPEIACIAEADGAYVPGLRPSKLAEDSTPTEPVLRHIVDILDAEGERPDAIVLLQPTSPIRLPGSIGRALNLFNSTNADSLVSMVETHDFFWRLPEGENQSPVAEYDFRNRPRRQDMSQSDRRYKENGSIYIARTEILYSENNRLGGEIMGFVMDGVEGYEIDTVTDFTIVEALMRSVDMLK
jgi:CMP-N,N'-diacetyllegionaminic acid synthase